MKHILNPLDNHQEFHQLNEALILQTKTIEKINPLERKERAIDNIIKHPKETEKENNEQRVIRQMIEALLFENIIKYHYQSGIFIFSIGRNSYQAMGYIGGFNRIRLTSNSIKQKDNSQGAKPELKKIVDELITSQSIKQQLQKELEQTIKLCDWNQQQESLLISRRHLHYRELESAIDEGHPYHPCFKARTGFSLEDHALYGPEQGNEFQLQWIAIRRYHLKQRIELQGELNYHEDKHFWITELGIDCWAILQQRMLDKGLNWEEYSLLPIHPWQWKNIHSSLKEPLSQQHLVYLGSAGDFYQASISVRTLLNVTHPQKANIKLPMNMVNSSSLRVLEEHSICTAPLLSNWLSTLINNDPFFQKKTSLCILPEYAGIRPQSETWTEKFSGQLGVIFRESVELKHPKENVIPFVALMVTEADNQPFIHPWIKRFGCEEWLSQLVDVAIIPVWHLLVQHGIAIEAHAQNLILSHEKGWPVKIIVRDFHESLEYVEDYITSPELIPDFGNLENCYIDSNEDLYYWMNNKEALRELFVDTLFVFNLSELANLLKRHYKFNEGKFWEIVKSRLLHYKKSGYTSDKRVNEMNIHGGLIKTESLLRKKFSQEKNKEYHHTINNPLSISSDIDKHINNEIKDQLNVSY